MVKQIWDEYVQESEHGGYEYELDDFQLYLESGYGIKLSRDEILWELTW